MVKDVGETGFGPATLCSQSICSDQTELLADNGWYPVQDLHPHAFQHKDLDLACLLIPPTGQKIYGARRGN